MLNVLCSVRFVRNLPSLGDHGVAFCVLVSYTHFVIDITLSFIRVRNIILNSYSVEILTPFWLKSDLPMTSLVRYHNVEWELAMMIIRGVLICGH